MHFEEGDDRRIGMNNHLTYRGVSINESHTLRDLNKILRDHLPEGFPYVAYKTGEGRVNVKWSEALFVQLQNQMIAGQTTKYAQLIMPTINTLNEDLAPTKKRKRNGEMGGVLSIFQRWDRGEFSITSHQLRHMLDTMAAVNGMEGQIRAKWAMRSDPKHNRYYDHTTPDEYGHDFREYRESEVAKQEGANTNSTF
nr:hypothetical protein [Endozoicomonas sp.]